MPSLGSPARLLVVHGDPDCRERVRAQLAGRWQVDTAADAAGAAAIAGRTDPDLVLTGIPFPGQADLPAGTAVVHLAETDLAGAVAAHLELARLRRRVAADDAYRAALTTALRSLTDPAEIQAAASALLARHLDVSRAYFAGPEERGLVRVHRDVHVGLPSLAGVYRAADFGDDIIDGLTSNHTLVAGDLDDLHLDAAVRSAWDAIAIAAVIAVPLVRDGRWLGTLTVAHHEPRAWSGDEVALAEETAERTWASVDRARAEAALRAAERELHRRRSPSN